MSDRAVRFVIPLRLQQENKRNRPIREKGGKVKFITRVDVPEAAAFKAQARVFAISAMEGRLPFDEPLEVRIRFHRDRPQSARKYDLWPHKRPDLDNYEKLAFDAMEGVVYVDDARICLKHSAKVFVEPDGYERIEVEIEPLQDDWPYDRRVKEG